MVCKTEKVVSKSLEKAVEALKRHIQSVESEVGVHADETGFKERGKKRWAWVAITVFVAVFIIRQGRSKQVAKELLGEHFSGILCSDRYSAYNWVQANQRQLCWAHLERDFRKLSERTGTSSIIGAELLELTYQLFHHWHEFKDNAISRGQLRRRTKPIRTRVELLLERGIKSRNKKTAGTCRSVLAYKGALWRFLETENIEPANNLAERIIRPLVIWRKTSFGTQSALGSLCMERIMSVVTTCQLQSRNTLEYLTAAVKAYLNKDAFPSLVPVVGDQGLALAA